MLIMVLAVIVGWPFQGWSHQSLIIPLLQSLCPKIFLSISDHHISPQMLSFHQWCCSDIDICKRLKPLQVLFHSWRYACMAIMGHTLTSAKWVTDGDQEGFAKAGRTHGAEMFLFKDWNRTPWNLEVYPLCRWSYMFSCPPGCSSYPLYRLWREIKIVIIKSCMCWHHSLTMHGIILHAFHFLFYNIFLTSSQRSPRHC